MARKGNLLTVFTKPRPEKCLPEPADFVADLGLDGVELPVRPGFLVTAEKVAADLPKAAKVFEDLHLIRLIKQDAALARSLTAAS